MDLLIDEYNWSQYVVRHCLAVHCSTRALAGWSRHLVLTFSISLLVPLLARRSTLCVCFALPCLALPCLAMRCSFCCTASLRIASLRTALLPHSSRALVGLVTVQMISLFTHQRALIAEFQHLMFLCSDLLIDEYNWSQYVV